MPEQETTQTDEVAVVDSSDNIIISEQKVSIRTLKRFIGTPSVPKRWKSLSDMIAAVMYGTELGLAPLESLQRLYIINGAVACDSKGLNALIHNAGHVLVYEEMSATRCAIKAMRRDPYTHELIDVGTFEFTWEDAERAELASQDTYQMYPQDMLAARTVSRAGKLAFPDVTTGMLLPQELDESYAVVDINEEEAATAVLEEILDAEEVFEEREYEE